MGFSSGERTKIWNARTRAETALATPMATALRGWQDESKSDAERDAYYAELQALMVQEFELSEQKFKEINDAAKGSVSIDGLTAASQDALAEADKLKKAAATISEIAEAVAMITGVVTTLSGLLV